MKKYIIKLLILLTILIIIINYEKYIDQEKVDIKVKIVSIKEDISEGKIIDETDLTEVWILKSNFNDNLVEFNSDIIGKISNVNLIKNQIIYKNQFEKKEFRLEKNQRLITVKLNIEESNGWNLIRNQVIDLIMINNETNYNITLSDVIVLKVFSENLVEIKTPFNNEVIPKYVSLVVSESQQKDYFNNCNKTQAFIVIK